MARSNPIPPSWSALPPNTEYGCESPYIGQVMPGRGGGKVTACVTPSRAAPREGQFKVGGRRVSKRVVRDRIRDATRGLEADDPMEVAARVDAAQRDPDRIPAATGLEFPSRPGSSVCSPKHPLWGPAYRDAVELAHERGALAAEGGSDAEYREEVARAFQGVPGVQKYYAAEDQCVREHTARAKEKRGGAVYSGQREEGQRRARALASREDVTTTDYREGGRGRTVAKRRNAKVVVRLELTAAESARWYRDPIYESAIRRQAAALGARYGGAVEIRISGTRR